MAVLNAIAAKENCTLLKILYPQVEEIPRTLLDVPICALIDSGGSPMDIANVATSLVEEGFSAIKIKVGASILNYLLPVNCFIIHILHDA